MCLLNYVFVVWAVIPLPRWWVEMMWQAGLNKPRYCPQISRRSSKCIWFGRCNLNLPVWVDRTRLHSQHAFQQVCLLTLTWLLKSHSCGDRSQAAHCRGLSFPPLDRCSPLNPWHHNQHMSSCPVWPLGQWNERTRAFSVEAALVCKLMTSFNET